MERPHFFIAYGTKSPDGLKTFRQTEYEALREHARNRANAKEKKREETNRSSDLFAGHDAQVQEAGLRQLVEEQKRAARTDLLKMLRQHGAVQFSWIVLSLLEAHMLREKNVKDICVDLAREGQIENTWGGGNRKPRDEDFIRLRGA